MTFAQIVSAVCDYCNLTSAEAQTRVGKAVNRHHKRITSTLGLDASRFVSRSLAVTPGVQTVTFTEIEKIDRVLDTTDSSNSVLLKEVSLDELRSEHPDTGSAKRWALQNTDADSVTIRLDAIPQNADTLTADGVSTLSDLSGSDEPAFPESFHDILSWAVISDELLKKEKDKLALIYKAKADDLLADLRFHLADSPGRSTTQGGRDSVSAFSSGSSGGAGNVGGTAYTQTALLTFDRGAGLAPFAVAQATAAAVTNLDADKVDGLHAADIVTAATVAAQAAIIPVDLASEVTGRLPFANLVTGTANTLVGRQSGSGGDLGLIALGTNLSMSGSTLNAADTVPAGSASEVQFRDGGVFGSDAAFQFNKATDTLSVPLIDISAAAGGQVTFPATQNPSSDANTLDDYEEFTWTPAIGGPGGQSGQAYTRQVGRGVKIGKLVTCWGRVTLSTLGSITGNVLITGLPFTAENTTDLYGDVHINFWASLTSSFAFFGGQIVPGDSSITLTKTTAAATGTGTVAQGDLSNTTDIIFKAAYRAAN